MSQRFRARHDAKISGAMTVVGWEVKSPYPTGNTADFTKMQMTKIARAEGLAVYWPWYVIRVRVTG